MDNPLKIISIEPYNEHYILVTHPESEKFLKFETHIHSLGGEKLPDSCVENKQSMKSWLVDKTKKLQVIELKNSLDHEMLFTSAFSSFTNQKEQKKYRRAMSDDENSSDEDIDNSPKKTLKLVITQDDLYSSESSDSEHEDSDDSDFPEAKSPKNHKKRYKKILKRFSRSPKNKK